MALVMPAETAPFDAGCGDIIPFPYECQYGYVDAWVHAAAASSPSSLSVLTFDGGHGEEYTAAASWIDMDMDVDHAKEPPRLISYGSTAATATSTCCFSFVASGDSGTVTTPISAVSSSQKRSRAPSSQGAELQESNHKKHRATNNKETQISSAAKSRREGISERLKALQELVPSGGKVDMVTMLDKAISYVKFMQLQLRVLETDAFWPAPDGTAPDVSQVNDALHAIIGLSSSSSQQACEFS